MTNFKSIKALEIKTSMLFSLDFTSDNILPFKLFLLLLNY